MASGSTGSYFPKWQLAALIGAPIAIGLTYLYYRRSTTVTGDEASDEKKKLSDKAVSIDKGDGEPAAAQKNLTPLEQAQQHKSDGNSYFHKGQYDKAIEAYDQAIMACPLENAIDLATFYQNRAAAYEQLGRWNKVIEDCSRALDLNNRYLKALQRRARAFEKTDKFEDSLEDITAVCILQRFSNSGSLVHADRVLKSVGQKHAKELLKDRKPVKPSKHFVKNYFASFLQDPIVNMSVSSEDPQKPGFVKAKLAFDRQDYDKVVENCTAEIDSKEETEYKIYALLLRATFYVITGQFNEATADLNRLLDEPNLDKKIRVNALIKKASLDMQIDRAMDCFTNFTEAEKIDPNNSDLYHHRGQVFTLMDQMDNAINDFRKACELAPDHGVTFVHKCYGEYRSALQSGNQLALQEVIENFRQAIQRFPDCVECYSLMAQILSEQGQFGPAEEFFVKACKVDPQNATILVHRGLLHLQKSGDITEAVKLIKEAIQLDDKCEFAYETLGTVEVQCGRLESAIELFDKAISLAKTELELIHLCSLKDAAVAQINVAKKFGIDIQSMAAITRSNSDA